MTDSANTEKKTKPRGGVQPSRQAAKSKIAVQMRRKKIIKALADGKTLKEAGIIGGLNPNNAESQVCKTLKNPQIQNALLIAMDKHGVSDDCIAERLYALLNGKKVIAANVFAPGSGTELADANSMTKDFVEVDDNVAIAKGIELACKIKGQFAADKHDVNLKRPINVIIRRFCDDEDSPEGEGAT